MRMKKTFVLLIVLMIGFLVACGNDEVEEADELVPLEVEFIVPDTAEPGEAVELEAIVTFGDENVEDADEVMFEYWLKGNEDDSTEIEGVHTENGSYGATITFEEDGVYEMYAHTTAEGLHTMPLTSITIGEGGEAEQDAGHDDDGDHDHEHADGFNLHFMNPETISVDEEIDLVVHLQMDGEAFGDATVRYEIAPENDAANTAWVDVEETEVGEYAAQHTFEETGIYTIVIHVEDDADLHEHDNFTVEVE